MSLDVLNSKEIDVLCHTLRCDAMQCPLIDTDAIQLETLSYIVVFSHEISNGNSTTRIESDKLLHVVGTLYPQESVVYHITGGLKLFYRANTSTSTTPPSADWTFLGTPFIESVVWVAGSILVVYEGYYYTCITTTTINQPFNAAEWTRNNQADTEVGNTSILENQTTVGGTNITLGRNSKDYEGMLILRTAQSEVSELVSRTGNIVLQPAHGTPSIPLSVNNKGVINYDISNNFYLRKSKATATDISNSFIFNGFTLDTLTTKQLCSINEKYYPNVAAPFGELDTEIVSSCGYVFRDFSAGAKTHGTATLVGGTITVATEACGPSSHIFLQLTTIGGTAGTVRVSSKTQTGFTILSTNALDTSTFDWLLINPNFNPGP
jgi:hypothetical protein